jgi:hypothetical protein
MFRTAFIALFVVLLSLVAPANAQAGWSKAALLDRTRALLGTAELPTETIASLPGNVFLYDPEEQPSCFAGSSDQITAVTISDFASALLIGPEDEIHTVWFYFPVVSVREPERALVFFAGFFAEMFPRWDGARTWAEQSLSDSWAQGARAFDDPMISIDDTVARVTVDGAKLATWGVPPDIVTYRVTTRIECEVISQAALETPRRPVCDDRGAPSVDSQRIRFSFAYTEPIDLSQTPYLLGTAYGSVWPRNSPLSFNIPGIDLTKSDWAAWFAKQPQGRFTVEQMLREDWNCTRNFIFRAVAPMLDAGGDGATRLLITNLSGDVTPPHLGGLSFVPERVSGLALATALPSDPPLPPPSEPPYAAVQPGQEIFEDEGTPVPIDISSTPIYLGTIHATAGGSNARLAEELSITIDGLTAVVTDELGSAPATVNLVDWLEIQRGVAPAEGRARPISHPEMSIILNDTSYLLAVTWAMFLVDDAGKPTELANLTVNVFRASR